MKSKIGGVSISKEDIEHLLLATVTSLIVIGIAFCTTKNEESVSNKLTVAKSSEINEDNKNSSIDFKLESYNRPAYKAYANQKISSNIMELERRLEVPEISKLRNNDMTISTFCKEIDEQHIPLTELVKETTTNNEIEELSVAYGEVAIVAEKSAVTRLPLASEPEANIVEAEKIIRSDSTKISSDESKDDVVIHESVSSNGLQNRVSITEVPAKIASAYDGDKILENELTPLVEQKQEIEAETLEKIVLQLNPEESIEVEDVSTNSVKLLTESNDIVDIAAVSNNLITEEALITEATPIDTSYQGCVINVGEQRDLLERLVMGEAGNQGFEGAALVAQSLRDNMIAKGTTDVVELKKKMAYSGSTSKEPNDDVKIAVAFIFDQGGCAVQHRINYFYNPDIVRSGFHESQQFVIEYKNHRFFSTW